VDEYHAAVPMSHRARAATRLYVLARHAESTANVARVVSSDPARPVELTERGRAQARTLGAQLAGLEIDLAIATRFRRTQQTAEVALEGRGVPLLIEPGLDEIQAGECDDAPIERYWRWNEHHSESDRFPHGESMQQALARYAGAVRRLLSRTERVTLVVFHEFALRRVAEAATGSSSLSDAAFANAVPHLFHEQALARAVAALGVTARSSQAAPASSATGGGA
jgi:broad specificity phosphatase PhoE